MDFSIILAQNTRDDDFVNATELCKRFGKSITQFERTTETKKYKKALSEKLDSDKSAYPTYIKEGKYTYYHPLLAIKLAEWLSPDFHIYVNETFKRYLEADITLAESIIERTSDNKDLDRLIERAEGKKVRNLFTDELKSRGVTGNGYGQNTNAVYNGLFDMNATELKDALQVKNPRDGMSAIELAALRLAELSAIARMDTVNATGNKETVKCSHSAAKDVKQVLVNNTNPDIPVFEF